MLFCISFDWRSTSGVERVNHFNTRVRPDEVSKPISHKEQRNAKLKRGGRASEGSLKNPRAASLVAEWSADRPAVREDPRSNRPVINAFFSLVSIEGVRLVLNGLTTSIPEYVLTRSREKLKLKRGGQASEGSLKNPCAASLVAEWSADRPAEFVVSAPSLNSFKAWYDTVQK